MLHHVVNRDTGEAMAIEECLGAPYDSRSSLSAALRWIRHVSPCSQTSLPSVDTPREDCLNNDDLSTIRADPVACAAGALPEGPVPGRLIEPIRNAGAIPAG